VNGKAMAVPMVAPPPDGPLKKPADVPVGLGQWLNRLPSLRTLLMAAGILVVAASAAVFWLRGGRYASTDDAYVQAAKLMVSTDVSGLVASVDVRENQLVTAGQLLFRVDTRQFQIALDNARANLAQISLTIESMKDDYRRMLSDAAAQEAQVALDQVTFDRFADLVKRDDVSRANYDQARYTLALDKGRLAPQDGASHSQEARIRADWRNTAHRGPSQHADPRRRGGTIDGTLSQTSDQVHL
jgi:multidrug resistance efflux pump